MEGKTIGNPTIGWSNTAIYRNFQLLLSKKLDNLEIKNGQYDFFYVIASNEGITQKEIAEILSIGKSTVAKAVKNLTDKGYVEKRINSRDKRVEHLFLTDSGKKMAPKVKAIFIENLEVAERGLSVAEKDLLISLMQKVLRNVADENNRLDTKNNKGR